MFLLFDIGGTKLRVAASRDLVSFATPVVMATPAEYPEGIAALIEALKECAGGEQVEGIAGGVPGPVGRGHEKMLGAGNLKGWIGHAVVADLEKAFGIRALLENDAALAGLGEAHFGAGKGNDIVAYLTVSTGVGGGRIVGGKIDAFAAGFEPGQQIIDSGRTRCPDCKSGKLEDLVSGTSVYARLNKLPKDVSQSDPLWETLAAWLAVGINNTTVYWSPDVIVLGGAMITGNPSISIEAVTQHLAELDPIFPPPPLKKAELKDAGGLYGAMALLRQARLPDGQGSGG